MFLICLTGVFAQYEKPIINSTLNETPINVTMPLNDTLPPPANPICGQTFTNDYMGAVLTSDLECSDKTALIIRANEFTLDCQGHTIRNIGNSTRSVAGVLVNSWSMVNAVNIINCKIEGFTYGISVAGGFKTDVANTTFTDNKFQMSVQLGIAGPSSYTRLCNVNYISTGPGKVWYNLYDKGTFTRTFDICDYVI